jgi:hypothetical protein
MRNLEVMYVKIIEGNTTDYQILCANCNWIKRAEKNENRLGSSNYSRIKHRSSWRADVKLPAQAVHVNGPVASVFNSSSGQEPDPDQNRGQRAGFDLERGPRDTVSEEIQKPGEQMSSLANVTTDL